MAEEVQYTKSTAQLDLERRRANGNESSLKIGGANPPSQSGLDVGGFLGTDPDYQNYADVTGQPFSGDEDDEPKKKHSPPRPKVK